jgi:CHASE3 domain sensor protein
MFLLKRLSPNKRLLTPLYISLSILTLLILLQGGLNLFLGYLNREAWDWVTHTLLIQKEGQHLLVTALQEQSNLRGYLITGDGTFIYNYQNEKNNFSQTFNRLYLEIGDNTSQIQRLNNIKKFTSDGKMNSLKRLLARD